MLREFSGGTRECKERQQHIHDMMKWKDSEEQGERPQLPAPGAPWEHWEHAAWQHAGS
jgi:hypothetical protein